MRWVRVRVSVRVKVSVRAMTQMCQAGYCAMGGIQHVTAAIGCYGYCTVRVRVKFGVRIRARIRARIRIRIRIRVSYENHK